HPDRTAQPVQASIRLPPQRITTPGTRLETRLGTAATQPPAHTGSKLRSSSLESLNRLVNTRDPHTPIIQRGANKNTTAHRLCG
ncbi:MULTISPECIES: hypothetical protein, partial [unclassified Pseudarthrobacter]|uniref:hypothetical protein n=1 Tax=unclassified Pseudarthrobacter TaxID=2647000 RepID=UPI0030785F43